MTLGLRRLRAADRSRGATAVEFALLVPFIVFVLGALVLLGLRTVYSAVNASAAKAAVRNAALPDGRAVTGRYLSAGQICADALAAYPGPFAPAGCGTGDDQLSVVACPDAGSTAACAALLAPACDTVAAPVLGARGGRFRALAAPLPRTATGASPTPTAAPETPEPTPTQPDFFPPRPDPTPLPTPTVPAAPPVPSPSVPVPQVTGTGAATAGTGVQLPTLPPSVELTPSAGPVQASIVASPDPSVALPRPPTPSRSPVQRCLDDRSAEGRTVVVELTWEVPVLKTLSGLAGGLLGPRIATVRARASGHRE